MGRMVGLTDVLRSELQRGNLYAFGEILHESWMLKRSLTDKRSSSVIADWYERTRGAGAIGGKFLGAGDGGFLLFFAPPYRHEKIAWTLPELRPVSCRLERSGTRIIFFHN